MFEYDKELIERKLKINGFESSDLYLDKIKHVPMHQYRVSTIEKPLLLIENLQVCIGLYAYSKNFAFAAHINPVVIRGDEFKCDANQNIIYCNRINVLFNEIIKATIQGPVYIGISIGFNPVDKTYQVVNMLNEAIDEIISNLDNLGIEAIKLDLRNNHTFIVDSTNGKIITSSNQDKQETTKRL